MNHLYLFGEVGWDVTVNDVKRYLDETDGDITIHVNSVGGFVFEGFAIYNMLKQSGRVKQANIIGLCASIATLIVNAADKVVMSDVAHYMIHNPLTWTAGESKDLQKDIEILDQIKTILIGVYTRKTKKSEAEISDLMDNESWFTPEMALENGFIDSIDADYVKAVARLGKPNFENKMSNTNEKKTLLNQIKDLINGVKEPKMILVELENGKNVFVDAENADELIGAEIFVAAEDGSKTNDMVENGSYNLMDGRIIEVVDGVVTSVTADEPEAKIDIEAFDAMLAKKDEEIENLKSQIADLSSDKAGLEKDVVDAESKVDELTNKFNEVETKLNELEGLVIGENDEPVVTDVKKDKVTLSERELKNQKMAEAIKAKKAEMKL